MRVYLAGPITGLTFPIANAWREQVVAALPPSIEFLNPLRYDRDDQVTFTHRSPAFNGMKNIVRRNYHDVLRSDLILACFEDCAYDNVSIGTVYELAWGYSLRKPTIAVIPGLIDESMIPSAAMVPGSQRPCNDYNHPYLKEAVDYLTDNLEEAIKIVRIIHSDGAF